MIVFLVILVGLIAGVALGMIFTLQLPPLFARYTAIALLATVDTLLGGTKAHLKEEFDEVVFITGFLMNIIAAILISYAGEKLGIELYFAVMLVFGIRIFQNISAIRYLILDRVRHRR